MLSFLLVSQAFYLSVTAPENHLPDIRIAAKLIGPQASCPEKNDDTIITVTSRRSLALSPGILAALYCLLTVLPVTMLVLISEGIHVKHNPVKIAEFYHLGDGMK
jgi:hypothetical protein